MRGDRLVRPFSPASNKLPTISFDQPVDRRSVNAKHGGELLEESLVDVTGLLESDDLVGGSDETRVAEELGDLPWAQDSN